MLCMLSSCILLTVSGKHGYIARGALCDVVVWLYESYLCRCGVATGAWYLGSGLLLETAWPPPFSLVRLSTLIGLCGLGSLTSLPSPLLYYTVGYFPLLLVRSSNTLLVLLI